MLNEAKYNQKQPLPTREERSKFLNLLQSITNGRYYAVDSAASRAGVSLLRACAALLEKAPEHALLVELILRISEIEKSLWQSWKVTDAPQLPKLWIDPVSAQPLRNPWLAPVDRLAIGIVLERDPLLAAYFEESATRPYQRAARLRDEAAHRAALNSIVYTSKDHEQNPWRSKDVTAAKQQGAFFRAQGELVTSIWKEEAAPVSLSWSAQTIHRTRMGKIIELLDSEPVQEINGDAISLAMKLDGLIRESERIAAEEELARAKQRRDET